MQEEKGFYDELRNMSYVLKNNIHAAGKVPQRFNICE